MRPPAARDCPSDSVDAERGGVGVHPETVRGNCRHRCGNGNCKTALRPGKHPPPQAPGRRGTCATRRRDSPPHAQRRRRECLSLLTGGDSRCHPALAFGRVSSGHQPFSSDAVRELRDASRTVGDTSRGRVSACWLPEAPGGRRLGHGCICV